jgi:hypothetical protein
MLYLWEQSVLKSVPGNDPYNNFSLLRNYYLDLCYSRFWHAIWF